MRKISFKNKSLALLYSLPTGDVKKDYCHPNLFSKGKNNILIPFVIFAPNFVKTPHGKRKK
jgi:hypothetical protein